MSPSFTGVVQQAGLGVLEQAARRLLPVLLVRADHAARAAADPAGHVLARDVVLAVDHSPRDVRDRAAALVEGNLRDRDALVADRAQHQRRSRASRALRSARAASEPSSRGSRRLRSITMRSTRSSPCSSTGEVRNLSTMRFGLPSGSRAAYSRRIRTFSRVVLSHSSESSHACDASSSSRSAGSTITSACSSSPSSSSSGIGEGGLHRAAAAEDHDLLDGVGSQQVDRVVGRVGLAQLVGAQRQHPRAVDRDVAVPDDDDALAVAELELAVGMVGMAVVPAHERRGGL